MYVMTRNPMLRDHVVAAILETAASVLAERGTAASMADVAAAAGVGRATLYRYFPNRQALVQALVRAAFTELADGLAAAGLETVEPAEGIARVTRVTLGAAVKYQALVLATSKPELPTEQLETPLIELFRRGAEQGTLRTDLSAETLLNLYTALLEGVIGKGLHHQLGVEQAAAAVTSVFLAGAAAPGA
jgi:AcrR family transcriptional regulator